MTKCTSCFKTEDMVCIQVREERGMPWKDSTVMRCANDECWSIRAGTRSDRIKWIRNVYDYKYFGDYELSPEQTQAVWEAFNLAASNPS